MLGVNISMGSFSLLLKKSTIPFFVFITGAGVLIIEIVATRILAPYFGNTIFALSSVISVVLLALSMGYFFGGKLADKYPRERLFYSLIALSGLSIVMLHISAIIFLSLFGYTLSLVSGPIIAAFLLFFLQNFLLGMLSPFAIKLQSTRLPQVGVATISGQIFFWSTLGSIAGSLSAGFLLIPRFGINSIIISVGFLLLTLGGLALLTINFWYRIFLSVIVLLFYLFFIHYFLSLLVINSSASVVYVKDGVYQKIVIHDGLYNQQPARFLSLDRDGTAAEFTNSSDLVYDYTKYYSLYKLFNPGIQNALMIGGGGYSVPKALLADNSLVHIDVAEIEPSLFSLAKQYFNVPTTPRLTNIIEDGRRLLSQSSKKYDVIFSDAYSSIYSTPSHLTTQEFFILAKSKLTTNGIFMANVIGSLDPKKESLALSEIKTFKSVFGNSYFFAVNSPSSLGLQNIIFIGYNSNNTIDVTSKAVRENKDPIIAHLAEKEIITSDYNFSLYPPLTDDFSPVEYLTSKEL